MGQQSADWELEVLSSGLAQGYPALVAKPE